MMIFWFFFNVGAGAFSTYSLVSGQGDPKIIIPCLVVNAFAALFCLTVIAVGR